MSWTPLTLQAPTSNSAALASRLRMIAVDPWTPGVCSGIGSNTNLSFPNAVEAIVSQLTGETGAGLAIALAAASLEGLSAQIATLANAFPMPNLERLARRAAKMALLELSKFNLVPPVNDSLGIAINALPTIRSLQRADLIAAAFDAAESFKTSNANDNLDDFAAEKSAYASMVSGIQAEASAGLTGTVGWRFYAANNLASAIRNGHPGHDYPFTSIMLFVGEVADLSILTEIFPPPP